MTRDEKFFGSLVVIFACLFGFRLICQDIIDHPNGHGLFSAACDLFAGILITRSVWRDRL
jgi:hypothetical protein